MAILKDASCAQKILVDWWPLYEAGHAEFFQGEPGKPDGYPLPEFTERDMAPVGMLGMCVIHNLQSGEWFLAPARQGVDAWEIAAAYARLGCRPPLILINQLTNRPRIPLKECHLILDIFRQSLETQQDDLSGLGQVLLHIKSGLTSG